MSSKAKRAPRGSVKESMPVPYTASSPFAVGGLLSRAATPRPSPSPSPRGGLFSRVVSAARRLLPGAPSALRYGDVLRDTPFHLHTRVVVFFSTHPSQCEALFAARPGDCLRPARGPWAGTRAAVVGARGGQLWVVGSAGPATARPLPAEERARHGWERVEGADAELQERLREGRRAARRDAELDYDADQKEFLQKAPDLFAEVVDDDAGDDDGSETEDDARGRGSAVRGVSAEDEGEEAERDSALLSGRQRKQVILVPQIVQATGGLGWAGEGMVLVNGGGVESFSASLSASVLL